MSVSKQKIRVIASGLLIASSIVFLSSCKQGLKALKEPSEQAFKEGVDWVTREAGEQGLKTVPEEAAEQAARVAARVAARETGEQAVQSAAVRLSAQNAADSKMAIIRSVSEEAFIEMCTANVEFLFSKIFEEAYATASAKAKDLEEQGFSISEEGIRKVSAEATNKAISAACGELIQAGMGQ